jgi:hypothetical protein
MDEVMKMNSISHATYSTTLQVQCSKCGRILGYYNGETFWIEGIHPKDAKVICTECKKEKEAKPT